MTGRLLVTMLALTAVLLGVLVVPLGVETARSERRDLRGKVERDATAVASLAEDALQARTPPPLALREIARRYVDETGGRVVVVDADGISMVDSAAPAGRDFASRPEIRRALAGETAVGTRYSQTLGTRLLYVAVPIASGGRVYGASRITYPTATADERVRHTWLALGALSAFALLVAAGLAVWLARWASRPLVRLEGAATGVAEGDLDVRAPVEGPPEVRAVAESFNEMVERVEGMLDDQSAFVADASHQLRTPLTALRLRLENLAADAGPDAQDEIEAATDEVDRLAELVDGLLALARAESPSAPPDPLDLGAVVRERVEAWAALADERRIRLSADVESGAVVRARRDHVEQALDNLVSNAVEAIGEGGTVTVIVAVDRGAVEIRVRDDGPGLSADDRRHAFDRFWRRRKTPGTGLGLAIARRLVETDDGTLDLEDAPGRGLDAVIRYRRA